VLLALDIASNKATGDGANAMGLLRYDPVVLNGLRIIHQEEKHGDFTEILHTADQGPLYFSDHQLLPLESSASEAGFGDQDTWWEKFGERFLDYHLLHIANLDVSLSLP